MLEAKAFRPALERAKDRIVTASRVRPIEPSSVGFESGRYDGMIELLTYIYTTAGLPCPYKVK